MSLDSSVGRPLNVRNSLEVITALEELYVDDDDDSDDDESSDDDSAAVAVEGERVDVDVDIAAMDNII